MRAIYRDKSCVSGIAADYLAQFRQRKDNWWKTDAKSILGMLLAKAEKLLDDEACDWNTGQHCVNLIRWFTVLAAMCHRLTTFSLCIWYRRLIVSVPFFILHILHDLPFSDIFILKNTAVTRSALGDVFYAFRTPRQCSSRIDYPLYNGVHFS